MEKLQRPKLCSFSIFPFTENHLIFNRTDSVVLTTRYPRRKSDKCWKLYFLKYYKIVKSYMAFKIAAIEYYERCCCYSYFNGNLWTFMFVLYFSQNVFILPPCYLSLRYCSIFVYDSHNCIFFLSKHISRVRTLNNLSFINTCQLLTFKNTYWII